MSGRIKVGAMLLVAWFAIATVQLAALDGAATPEPPLPQSTVSPLGALGEPAVLLLLGALLATVGILVRRSSSSHARAANPITICAPTTASAAPTTSGIVGCYPSTSHKQPNEAAM